MFGFLIPISFPIILLSIVFALVLVQHVQGSALNLVYVFLTVSMPCGLQLLDPTVVPSLRGKTAFEERMSGWVWFGSMFETFVHTGIVSVRHWCIMSYIITMLHVLKLSAQERELRRKTKTL